MERLSHAIATEYTGSEETKIMFASAWARPPDSSKIYDDESPSSSWSLSLVVAPFRTAKMMRIFFSLSLFLFFLSFLSLSLHRYSTSDWKPDLQIWHSTYLGLSPSTRSTLSPPASCVIIVFGWHCWTGAEIHQVLVNLPWVTTAGWPEENDYEIKLLCLNNKDNWYAGQDGSKVNLFLYMTMV